MSQEGIELLISIDRTLKALLAVVQPLAQQARAAQPKPIADDRDLDGKYGDPVVKLNPRDWTGPALKGRRMSECPAAFLELLAKMFDYFADQAEQKHEMTNGGKPVAPYRRADAARARGWAKRIKDGKHTPPVVEDQPDGGDDNEWAGSQDGWS